MGLIAIRSTSSNYYKIKLKLANAFEIIIIRVF